MFVNCFVFGLGGVQAPEPEVDVRGDEFGEFVEELFLAPDRDFFEVRGLAAACIFNDH